MSELLTDWKTKGHEKKTWYAINHKSFRTLMSWDFFFILILCDRFQNGNGNIHIPKIPPVRKKIEKIYFQQFFGSICIKSNFIDENAFKELMKNVCRCVLIFTNIVKVSLLVAQCAQLHMCSAVTLSKSDLQLFILNPHLGRCSYQLAAQTCLESDNNKSKLTWKGLRDGPLISIWSGLSWLVWSFVDEHG